ncbi:MAG: exosortase/archaeosortase family protein [Tepidisphaeraceae bacterium]
MSVSPSQPFDVPPAGAARPQTRTPVAPAQPRGLRRKIATTLKSERLSAWHGAAALVLAALGIGATFGAWQDIYAIAITDEEYSHIFIVPVIAVVLAWIRRMRIRHCRPTGTALGALMVAVGGASYVYGFNHGHDALWHGGAVLAVLGCVIAVLGKNVLFRFFPAVLVLLFMIPVPGMIRQQISLPLQAWTAQIAQALLQAFGVENIELWGNTLRINDQLVTIAEACNGMRGLFALILVSYAFSFALPLRNSVRVIVLLCSPLAAIFCNVLRTLPTIWLYGQGKAWQEFANAFHNYAGWAMLPIAFLMLYGVIQLLKWAAVPVTRYPLASQ